MISKEDIQKFFDLAELEAKEEELRKDELKREIKNTEEKERMIEYLIEHLNPSALIAVHQTNHFPEDGVLKPTGHFLFPFFKNGNAKKIIEDLQLKHGRITIHFTLNYPVVGVAANGQWVEWDCKYGILIPVNDFIDRIKCINPVDTWIIGALKLSTSSEILVPEDEYYQEWKNFDTLTFPAKIIPYPDGTDLKGAIKTRIRKRGYRLMDGGDFDWYQQQDLQHIVNFINKSVLIPYEEKERLIRLCTTKGFKVWINVFEELANKLKKSAKPHLQTEWRKLELWLEEKCSMLLNPKEDELKQPASNFNLKLVSFQSGAERYKKEMSQLIESQ